MSSHISTEHYPSHTNLPPVKEYTSAEKAGVSDVVRQIQAEDSDKQLSFNGADAGPPGEQENFQTFASRQQEETKELAADDNPF